MGRATDGSKGHVRPLCALAARLVKLRDINITFLIARKTYEKVTEELSKNFEDGEDALRTRIRYHTLKLLKCILC